MDDSLLPVCHLRCFWSVETICFADEKTSKKSESTLLHEGLQEHRMGPSLGHLPCSLFAGVCCNCKCNLTSHFHWMFHDAVFLSTMLKLLLPVAFLAGLQNEFFLVAGVQIRSVPSVDGLSHLVQCCRGNRVRLHGRVDSKSLRE